MYKRSNAFVNIKFDLLIVRPLRMVGTTGRSLFVDESRKHFGHVGHAHATGAQEKCDGCARSVKIS